MIPKKEKEYIEKKTEKAIGLLEIAKKIIGIIFIVAGIAGLFLPFLQGILMIIIGLLLTGNHKILDWLKKKLRKHYRKHYENAHKFLKKRGIHILSIKKRTKK